jgi:hypothetical protein
MIEYGIYYNEINYMKERVASWFENGLPTFMMMKMKTIPPKIFQELGDIISGYRAIATNSEDAWKYDPRKRAQRCIDFPKIVLIHPIHENILADRV